MIYADTAATAPLRREVLEAMWPYLAGGLDGVFGNPSSVHLAGRQAAEALGQAREVIARELDCRPGEVVLTSGGTEADNLALKGIALATPRGRHLVTTPIEHEAVLASADYLVRHHGFQLSLVEPDGEGRIDPSRLESVLRPDTTLVSIHHANGEIGTVQPIAALAETARARGVPFHTDAVQSAGSLAVGRRGLGVDALSISGHKLGAPRGIGALVVAAGIPLEPLLHGGGQERGRRSGTEDVAAAVGLAAALIAARAERADSRLGEAGDALAESLLREAPGTRVTGSRRERLPGHVSVVVPGASGEAVLLELERRGVLGSSGSACAAGRTEPSHVLLGIGLDPVLAQSAVRLTLAASTTVDEARRLASVAAESIRAVRSLAG